MGVFARLFGRSSGTPAEASGAAGHAAPEELSTTEENPGTESGDGDAPVTSGSGRPEDVPGGRTGENQDPVKESAAEAGTAGSEKRGARSTEAAGSAAAEAEPPADGETDSVDDPERVGIPKQQSADEAADSEAGENAQK